LGISGISEFKQGKLASKNFRGGSVISMGGNKLEQLDEGNFESRWNSIAIKNKKTSKR